MQGKFLSELFSISILPTLPKTLEVFLNYKAKKEKKSTTMLVFFLVWINFKKPKNLRVWEFLSYSNILFDLYHTSNLRHYLKVRIFKASRKHDLFNNNSITVLNPPVAGEIFC